MLQITPIVCDIIIVDDGCFVFCGRTNGKPEFYDITNGAYISKIEDCHAKYKKHSLVKTIVVNGQNIVGNCERNGKLGAIDIGNRKAVHPQWDEQLEDEGNLQKRQT